MTDPIFGDETEEVVELELKEENLPASTSDFDVGFDIDNIPEAKEDCFQLIDELNLYIIKNATIGYWYIGKVIAHLIDGGEKGVVKEVAERLNLKPRAIQYYHSFYTKFPEKKDVKKIISASEKSFEWTDFRELTGVNKPENRTKLLNEMASGKIEREDFPEKIDKVKTKEKTADESSVAAQMGEKDRELKSVRRKVTQAAKYLTDTKFRMFDTIEQEVQHWLVTLDEDYQESSFKSFEDYSMESKMNQPLKALATRSSEIIRILQNVKAITENFVDNNMQHVKDDK
jgi:DNA-binding transcriptional MerR regulator